MQDQAQLPANESPALVLDTLEPEVVEDPAETSPVLIEEAPKKPALDPATRGFIE